MATRHVMYPQATGKDGALDIEKFRRDVVLGKKVVLRCELQICGDGVREIKYEAQGTVKAFSDSDVMLRDVIIMEDGAASHQSEWSIAYSMIKSYEAF